MRIRIHARVYWGSTMFACLVTAELLDIDTFTSNNNNNKSRSSPQVENTIEYFDSDPVKALQNDKERCHWFVVIAVSGFQSKEDCIKFVDEWKVGRKVIPKIVRCIEMCIDKNKAHNWRLGVCTPHYTHTSIQKLILHA